VRLDGRSALLGAVLFSPVKALRVVRKLGMGAVWLLLALVLLLRLAWQWWQGQPLLLQLLVVVLAAAVVLRAPLLAAGRRHSRAHLPHRRPAQPQPTQVLYRWWEPDDLLPGLVCFCGKPRRAGELVYVGITRADRARELDDDRRKSCWWQPGLTGSTETYATREQVETAEVRAIQTEHPRENKQHAGVW
jgi:hypothetical protein